MKKLIVNTNKWYFKLYFLFTGTSTKNLPKNTCSLRINLLSTIIIAIITYPISLPIIIINKLTNNFFDNNTPLNILFGHLFITSMVFLILLKSSNVEAAFNFYLIPDNYSLLTKISLIYSFATPIIFTIFISLIYIAFGIHYILSYLKSIRLSMKKSSNKNNSFFKKLYLSWKNNSCRPIEYNNNNK